MLWFRIRQIILAAAAVALAGCVSADLAQSNLDSVTTLAQVAVTADPESVPLANESVETAEEIVDATAWVQQVIHFGVPSALVDANAKHVEGLVAKVDPSKPNVKVAIEDARKNGEALRDRIKMGERFMHAAEGTPLGDKIVSGAEIFSTAVGILYSLTRGRTHLARWWNTPGKVPPAPPNADGPAASLPATPSGPPAAPPPAAPA